MDVLARVRSAGVKFIAGEANALVFDKTGEVVTGVTTKQGSTLSAGVVVLASGAWTSTLLPELAHDLLPTGQVVGTIQLSQQEADVYRNVPVSRSIERGFSCSDSSTGHLVARYWLVRRSIACRPLLVGANLPHFRYELQAIAFL